MYRRICRNCKKPYRDADDSPFVTCPSCRHALPQIAGGCTRFVMPGPFKILPLNTVMDAPDGRGRSGQQS